jgi:hypothetical protein
MSNTPIHVGETEQPGGASSTSPVHLNVTSERRASEFERQATSTSPGLVREMIAFLGETKKWWLAPIVLLLLLIGLLVVLGGSAAAPFIYTLF